MAKILITGGSGLLGRAISRQLIKNGHQVCWLSRRAGQFENITVYTWDLEKNVIDEKAFEGVETIIYLAGSGVMDQRWSRQYKQEILDSRVKGTVLLFKYLSDRGIKLKSFIGMSAVGYYGSSPSEHLYQEEDSSGNDFLSEVCKAWENSYRSIARLDIRTVVFRMSVVLSAEGGAYKKMKPLFKNRLGSVVGKGTQYVPWIHMDDVVAMVLYGIANEQLAGTYNAVSSEQINNFHFSKQLAESLKVGLYLPAIPEWFLSLVLGERALALTRGLKISNQKIKASGFNFKYNKLSSALDQLRINKTT